MEVYLYWIDLIISTFKSNKFNICTRKGVMKQSKYLYEKKKIDAEPMASPFDRSLSFKLCKT